jgi:hypothetical protein
LDPIEVLRFEQRAVKARRGGVELSRFYKGVPTYATCYSNSERGGGCPDGGRFGGRNGGAPDVTKVTYKKYERGFGG